MWCANGFLVGVMAEQDRPRLVELQLTNTITSLAFEVDLALTYAQIPQIYSSPNWWTKATNIKLGYIAGTGDGLLTVNGEVASREILLADADDIYQGFSHRTFSLKNGQYLITNLDPTKRYLVMARDYKGDYEPVCYDNVTPASDLTADELRGLWETMVSGN